MSRRNTSSAVIIVLVLLIAGALGSSRAVAPPVTTPAVPSPAEPIAATAVVSPSSVVSEYPEKGRTISLVVPYPPGGSADLCARVLAASLEQELNTPVRVVNKPGANGQAGYSEFANAKPDGYTVGFIVLPIMATLYMDKERNATFSRVDFTPVAMLAVDINAVAVPSNSRFNGLKDLVEAGVSKPEQLKIGITSFLGPYHLNVIQLEQMTGARFAPVQFDGGAPLLSALLGGHLDAAVHTMGNFSQQAKSGSLRVLAILNKDESKFLPGVKTAESQGYALRGYATHGLAVPAGTPARAINVLNRAVERLARSDEYLRQMDSIGQESKYLGPEQFGAHWASVEAEVGRLIDAARK